MNLGVERDRTSLYIYDVAGDVICYMPRIFEKQNQRQILKTLSIFLKHFKTEVDKHGPQRITKQD